MLKFIKRIAAAVAEKSFRTTLAGVGQIAGGIVVCIGGNLIIGGGLIAGGAGMLAAADHTTIKTMVNKTTEVQK